MNRAAVLVAALIAALLAAGSARAKQPARSPELPIKAAFLYKFGGFVDWPPRAFAGAQSPLVVCVIGRDPFGEALDQVARGRTAGERPVAVRRFEALTAETPCHIAYLGGGLRQSVAEALAAADGAPVLTVTDEDRGAARGAVHFVSTGGRVRFHIDDAKAQRRGLQISSKLLNLALSVRRAP